MSRKLSGNSFSIQIHIIAIVSPKCTHNVVDVLFGFVIRKMKRPMPFDVVTFYEVKFGTMNFIDWLAVVVEWRRIPPAISLPLYKYGTELAYSFTVFTHSALLLGRIAD